MALINSPNIIREGIVLGLDAANIRSFRGEPTTNVFTHYGTPGVGAAGNVSVTFSIQGTGTFVRLGYGQTYGNYLIEQRDVVYRYDLGTSGCHYHGNTVAISAGQYATFTFDYYVSPETTIESSFLANFENYGGGAFGGSVSANGLKGVWQTATFTSGPATSNGTLAMFLYPGGCSPSRFGNTGYILYKNPQVELRSTSTPFVNGTRGTTNATGGGWVDLSGRGNHGELVNGPTYSSANGGSIVFDGSNDYISIPNNSTLRPSTELTIEYAIKGNTPGGWCPIIGYGNGDYTNGNYLSWVEGGGALNALCRIITSGVTEYRQYSGQSISSSTWKIMCFTMKIGDAIRSYYNGADTNTPTSLPAGGTFYYGGTTSPYQIVGTGGALLTGNIGYMKLYNRALSGNEVLQNFEATRARFGV